MPDPAEPSPDQGPPGPTRTPDAVQATPRNPFTTFRLLPRPLRWASICGVLLVLALVATTVAGTLLVRRSFPQTDGELDVPGLTAGVRVVRDGEGIPQIYADNAHDLFFAQGFVHAQDRFYEMDVRRHVTSGRLSEMLGEDALETDKFIRTMGWRAVAESELRLLDADTIAYLEAYADGVNAYIGDKEPDELSLEYSVLSLNGLDYSPEPWTPADSVAWLKAMAWDLRGNMQNEIERSLLSVDYSPAEIAELFPPYPYGQHRPIVTGGAVVDGVFEQDATEGATREPARAAPFAPGALAALRRTRDAMDAVPDLVGSGDGVGSNSWVVSGEHTSTGKPLLANDPHLSTSVPGIWEQMGLHCTTISDACPFDVSGFTFSGFPGVVIGHNDRVAWGFTNLGPDVSDLYLEKVRDKKYLYDGRWLPLKEHDESIEVLGRDEPFTFSVRSTRHGPLLSDVSAQLSTVGANAPVDDPQAPDAGNGYAVALSWTALHPGRTADAIFTLDRASSWDDFRTAASQFEVPAQNLVYADVDGHIGYQAPGRIPARGPGNDGSYPSEGWLPENDWKGYVPFAALPSVEDPDRGYIVTANQAVTTPSYPFYLGDDWDYGYRSQRIDDLLAEDIASGDVSIDDMASIQLDDRNALAPVMVPYLLDLIMPSPYYAAGQRLLARWDYDQDAGSPAAAYFNAVYTKVLESTFDDQVREEIWPQGGSRWWAVLSNLLRQPDSLWWDDANTPTIVETRDDVLEQALRDARDQLTRLQARRALSWTWGHQHRLDLENQTVGQSDVGIVRWLFNRDDWEVGGGNSSVDATAWRADIDYTVSAAPSMRMVVSLADLDQSRWINLTGVSGHAFNEHYTDQTDLWAAGETLPWPFSPRAVQQAAEETLVLRPAKQQQ